MTTAEKLVSDPNSTTGWVHIGGDIEATYDGSAYVDFRERGSEDRLMFASRELLFRALSLFPPHKCACGACGDGAQR